MYPIKELEILPSCEKDFITIYIILNMFVEIESIWVMYVNLCYSMHFVKVELLCCTIFCLMLTTKSS